MSLVIDRTAAGIQGTVCIYLVHGSKQMKKNRLAAGAIALAVSFMACGCGDQVYEMTDEEKAVIVHYSAHVVTKFNKKQSEGVQDVTALKAQMAAREEQRKEEEELRKQEEEQQKEKEEQTKNQESSSVQESGQTDTDEPQVKYVSLSKALKLKDIRATYKKYEKSSIYAESSSFMVRADEGNELLVLHVNLKNTGNESARCDLLSRLPSFRLTVNGDVSVSADTSILLNDLGTYQGRIGAGDTVKTVLIFQVQQGMVKKVKSMDLEVSINGKSSIVQLVAGRS